MKILKAFYLKKGGQEIMAIRKALILFLLMGGHAFGQRLEVQRKFDLTDPLKIQTFVEQSENLEEFKTHFHSEYIFYDLYLDTPENDLFHQKLSLRLRKKILSDTLVSYVFQLKSEMDNFDGARMEVEEPELDYHRIKFHDDVIYLSQLLNIIFDNYFRQGEQGNVEDRNYYLVLLRIWIESRTNSTIAPFQKLKFMKPDLFTSEKIASLDVQFVGKAKRKRSHIYTTTSLVSSLGYELHNRISVQDLPPFFIEHPENIWLMESSLDSAYFFHAYEPFSLPAVVVSEFELENKYEHDTLGITLMNHFEEALLRKFNLTKSADSKYRQCVLKRSN